MEETPEEELPEVEVAQEVEEVAEDATGDEEKQASPAVVINLYSWATPIVGVIMLLLGAIGGYFAYPLVKSAFEASASPTQVASADIQSVQTEAPQPTVDPATRQQLMDYLVPQVKHFKGDANAPITLIEFSDFQ
jgi:hypothetical protein